MDLNVKELRVVPMQPFMNPSVLHLGSIYGALFLD